MLEPILEQIVNKGPLIHAITNSITSNDCANVILASGAFPTMAESEEEADEIASAADALVLNLGNPTPGKVRAMLLAGRAANRKGIPVVLDPVGVGASRFRTQAVRELLREVRVSVVRGNASEIRTLSNGQGYSRGVDAAWGDRVTTENLSSWKSFAQELADRLQTIVLVSGERDLIADTNHFCVICNGHSMMSKVTGTGCMLSALIGAYCGGSPDDVLNAVISAAGVMGISGEQAYRRVNREGAGTASFRTALIDAVSKINQTTLQEEIRVEY